MSNDDTHPKVYSVPPPPTDEIDDEWGGAAPTIEGGPAPAAPSSSSEPAPPKPSASGTPSGAPVAPPAAKHDEPAASGHGEDEEPDKDEEDEDEDNDDVAERDNEDEDEEDEDDEGEDEDEDDEDERRGRAARRATGGSAVARTLDDQLPEWAPWAVLAVLILLGVAGGLGLLGTVSSGGAARRSAAHEPSAPEPTAAQAAAPERVAASHFLVQYQGSLRAAPTITRTKEEARKRALEGLAKARKGVDFAQVVSEYSDEPGAAARGGGLGLFTRQQMIKPFADVAFALKVGQISDIVETPFGFHVIKRTQ